MDSPRGPDFADLVARLARELIARDIGFMLIGGQAVLLHGRPRLTEDIDVTVALGPDGLPTVLEACRAATLTPLPDDPGAFVHETFVLPVRDPATQIRVDFIFSTTPYERQAVTRAVRVDMKGVPVPFATAEDLIIHKLFAGRATDREDVIGVIRRQREHLDWDYLTHWAREFAQVPGREQLPDELEQLRRLAG